jgi:hypothetical protein
LITVLFAVEFCVLPSAIGFPDEGPDIQAVIVTEEICAAALRAGADLAGALNMKTCHSLSAEGIIAPRARSR